MGNAHNKFGKDWTCTSKNMITGRQTHRHAHHNTLLPYGGEVIMEFSAN